MINMKTYIKYILGISLLIISFSCRKDGSDITIPSTTDNSNNNKKILSLIHSYGEKMNSNLKSTELIEIDSVIWYTEALLNYNFSRPEILFKYFEVFKSNYTIPTEENELISLNYAQGFYHHAETSLANEYDQIPYDEKYLRFSDIVLDSIFEDNAYLSIYRGYGYDYEMEIYLPFEEDDDWIWGSLGTPIAPLAGKCDGTQI